MSDFEEILRLMDITITKLFSNNSDHIIKNYIKNMKSNLNIIDRQNNEDNDFITTINNLIFSNNINDLYLNESSCDNYNQYFDDNNLDDLFNEEMMNNIKKDFLLSDLDGKLVKDEYNFDDKTLSIFEDDEFISNDKQSFNIDYPVKIEEDEFISNDKQSFDIDYPVNIEEDDLPSNVLLYEDENNFFYDLDCDIVEDEKKNVR